MMSNSSFRRSVASIATAACLSVAAIATASAAPPTATSGTANGVDPTARWWQVASTRVSTFFADSTTGDNCVPVNLPSGTLVMVAGTLGGESGPRACTIPSGARVLLPAINYAEVGQATIGMDRHNARMVIDTATASSTVDGASTGVQRIRSSKFSVDTTQFGLPGVQSAVSDGYWLVVDLPDGDHTVMTTGADTLLDGTTFSTTTHYSFHVG